MDEPAGGRRGAGRFAPSLKARALQLLARREHSRIELARKLARHAENPAQLDALLDQLLAAGLLSNERFAESLVHRRAARYGTALIRHELRSHGLDPKLVDGHIATLASSESARARAVWVRRFGVVAGSLAERARQSRFLLARGFSAETVARIVGGGHEEDD